MSEIGKIDISQDLKKAEILRKQNELASRPKKTISKDQKSITTTDINTGLAPSGYNKYNEISRFLPVLYISIAIILAVIIRVHYASVPLMDDWAEQSAIATFRPGIVEEVEEMYPYYSEQQKKSQIEKDLDLALKEYKNLIDQKSSSLRDSFRDPDGNIYLYGIDPYYYYKKVKDRKLDDFLSFFSYYLHRFISFFDQDATLMQTSSYISIIFVALTIFPIFFITRRISNDLSGFIAAVIFAIHPEFLKFSLAGIADTNTLNIFFIMTISWLFIEILYMKSLRYRVLAGLGLLSLILIFFYTWKGYYIALGLILSYLIVSLGLFLFNKVFANLRISKRITYIVIIGILLIIISYIGFDIVMQFMPVKIQNYLGFSSQESIWPDTYSSITELKDVAFGDLISRIGGNVFFTIIIISIIFIFLKIIKSEEIPMAGMFIIISSMIFLVASVKAIRIFPFSLPFLIILFGFGVIKLLDYLDMSFTLIDIKDIRIKIIAYIIVVAFIIFMLSFPFLDNYKKVRMIKPRMDDSIYDSAIDIRENSTEIARIFTWWDKGHLYYAISDRTVLLQGNPTMPRVYWMAKSLLSADEELSIGVIRMLGCNGETYAFNMLGPKYANSEKIDILDQILILDRNDALEFIRDKGLDEELLRYTHCPPKETYLVVTDDMFTRFHNIQKYAFWDFDKGPDEQTKYNSFKAHECSRSNTTYTCMVDNHRVTLDSETGKTNINAKEIILFEEELNRFGLNKSDSRIVMIIYKRDNRYYCIVIDEDIADSLYIKLMILNGAGLKNFKLISEYSRPETLRVASYSIK